MSSEGGETYADSEDSGDVSRRRVHKRPSWAAAVSQTIDSTVEAINASLQSLKAGRGSLGKVAVIVDRDLAAEK
jgi:hypothetical protein